jgi:hypothetical protein
VHPVGTYLAGLYFISIYRIDGSHRRVSNKRGCHRYIFRPWHTTVLGGYAMVCYGGPEWFRIQTTRVHVHPRLQASILQRHKPNCFACKYGCSTATCSFTIGSFLVPEGFRHSTFAVGVYDSSRSFTQAYRRAAMTKFVGLALHKGGEMPIKWCVDPSFVRYGIPKSPEPLPLNLLP